MWNSILFSVLGFFSINNFLLVEENSVEAELLTFRVEPVENVEPIASSIISDLRPALALNDSVELSESVETKLENRKLWVWGGYFPLSAQHLLTQVIVDPLLNLYGIKELIGVAISDTSMARRGQRINMQAGIDKFDGVIIGKGETFSFNDTLKSVEPEEGFVVEAIIIGGRDGWALGGGVCQLSTVLYRAALNAGLPIEERRNHSDALGKYFPHGLDATIYLGSQDLKFTNDTGNDILIKTQLKGNTLMVALFGTQDGREIELTRVRNDHQRGGGLYTEWKRIVRKGNNAQEELIASRYKGVY